MCTPYRRKESFVPLTLQIYRLDPASFTNSCTYIASLFKMKRNSLQLRNQDNAFKIVVGTGLIFNYHAHRAHPLLYNRFCSPLHLRLGCCAIALPPPFKVTYQTFKRYRRRVVLILDRSCKDRTYRYDSQRSTYVRPPVPPLSVI